MARALRNGRMEQPYRRASYWGGGVLLGSRRFSEEQLFAAVAVLSGNVGLDLNSDVPFTVLSPTAAADAVQVGVLNQVVGVLLRL
jgi:hypothetical protein